MTLAQVKPATRPKAGIRVKRMRHSLVRSSPPLVCSQPERPSYHLLLAWHRSLLAWHHLLLASNHLPLASDRPQWAYQPYSEQEQAQAPQQHARRLVPERSSRHPQ